MSRIYLDSCIVIYFVEKHPEFAAAIEGRISSLSETDTLCYSPLTRMECLVKPLRVADDELRDNFELFFGEQEMLEITGSVFDMAAQLRAEFSSLKTPDALHLATTQYYRCDEFWTNDSRLDAVDPSIVKSILPA